LYLKEEPMVLCIVGYGEVGRIYAEALSAAGVTVDRICEPRFTDTSRESAAALGAGTEETLGPWLHEVDVVISAVTGSVASEVAEDCFRFMKADALFADLTTATPETMQDVASLARDRGIAFVDVAILGAVSIRKGKTALACAGEGAERFRNIADMLGAPLKVLPGPAGDAVRLKLLRSLFTKGLEALAVECLVAAERAHLRKDLYEILSDVDETPLIPFLEVLVRTHVLHAGRRHHEVSDAENQLLSDGLEPRVTPGVRGLFGRTAGAGSPPTGEQDSPSIEAALAWLADIASSGVRTDDAVRASA
jgi:3-hydroxyisobutyrate dehydrogenase-like beta-hydroxyacid dehydrogenase